MVRPVIPFLENVQGANVRTGGRGQCVSKVNYLQNKCQRVLLVVCHLTSIVIFHLFTGNDLYFQNVKSTNMDPRVNLTAGIVLISKTAKKHLEFAKRVVIVVGMDRTAITVSIQNKNKKNMRMNLVILVKLKFLTKEFDRSSRA